MELRHNRKEIVMLGVEQIACRFLILMEDIYLTHYRVVFRQT